MGDFPGSCVWVFGLRFGQPAGEDGAHEGVGPGDAGTDDGDFRGVGFVRGGEGDGDPCGGGADDAAASAGELPLAISC